MGNDEGQLKATGWPEWAAAGAILAAFCGLVLWGLGWGVPSRERARLEGAAGTARALTPEIIQQSWKIWGSRGRRGELADAYPRNLFNPIRSFHPDEYQVFKSLSNMRPGQLDFDPKSYIYPSLHTYLVGATVGACSALGIVKLERDVRYYFDHPDDMGRMYLAGRALSLLAAVGALLLVWREGQAMGRWTGLLAMGLLAAMPALGIHSHNLTRDTLTALAAIAFFACCRRLAQTGTAKWFDLAGGAAGLCAACQYFAVVVWALVPITAFLWWRREEGSKRAVASGLVASLVVMAAVFALTSPYHLLRADRFLADFGSETVHVGRGGFLSRAASFAWAVHLPRMAPAMVTWPVTAAVALGIVWAVARRQDEDWLLLAWLVVWAGVVGFDGRAYSRYYVGLLPALALIAARGLAATWDVCRRVVSPRWLRGGLAALVLAGVLCPAAAMTCAWSHLYAHENVRTIAGEWIARNVPPRARIGVTEWPWQYEMPPLDPRKYRLVVLADSPRQSPHDLQRLWHEKPDYFVTSNLQFGTMPVGARGGDERERFWRFLLVGRELYRTDKRFEVPQLFLGSDLMDLPEDMRYVNPIIYLLERRTGEARGPGGREAS